MSWYCYMLECKDSSLYTGVTNKPKERFKKHLKGEAAKYTRAKKPKNVVWFKKFDSQRSAMKKEAEIKGWRRDKKEKLISDFKVVAVEDFIESS